MKTRGPRKRAIVPGVSIWPQPKTNPRESYKITFGSGKNRKTVTGSTDLDTTIELAMRITKQRDRARLGLASPIEDKWAQQDIRPVAEHLEDYRQHLIAENKDHKHVRQMHSYARDILLGTPIVIDPKRKRGGMYAKLDGIGAGRISDIVASHVMKQVATVKASRSLATANRYLDAINAFLNWGVGDERWERNVCKHLAKYNADTDRKRVRRAISLSVFEMLVEKTRAGKVHSKLTGQKRSLIYRTCVTTGQRANEVRKMLVMDLQLDGEQLGVWVQAAVGKNRKRMFIPINPELAAELKIATAGKMPEQPALDVPDNTARMLKHDLKAAGILYKTSDGVFDFHAIRHQCGALLISAGVNPKAVQQHMRHSTIKLTMDTYGHVLDDDRAKTINALPTFNGKSASQAQIRQSNPEPSCGEPVTSEIGMAESHSANRGSIPRRSNLKSAFTENHATNSATNNDSQRLSSRGMRLPMRCARFIRMGGRVLPRVPRIISRRIAESVHDQVSVLLSRAGVAAGREA